MKISAIYIRPPDPSPFSLNGRGGGIFMLSLLNMSLALDGPLTLNFLYPTGLRYSLPVPSSIVESRASGISEKSAP